MNKSKIKKRQAGTEANSDKQPKLTTSSHHIAKPRVVRSPNVLSVKSKLENKVKVYEWFYCQLESLIKSANLALKANGSNSIVYVGNLKLTTPNDTNKETKKDTAL